MPVHVEASIEINRPPEDVYEFMANVNNLPRCSSAIQEVNDAPERAIEQGDTYTSVAKVMGRTITTSHRVEQADFPSRLEIEGKTGNTVISVTIRFEPTEVGTRVIQSGEGEPGGALRFAGPILERTMRRQLREDLDNLKKILEQES
jgi:carbon monoxide dehydrogenase subunit G